MYTDLSELTPASAGGAAAAGDTTPAGATIGSAGVGIGAEATLSLLFRSLSQMSRYTKELLPQSAVSVLP